MEKCIQDIAKQTAEASQLSAGEQAEIQRELTSYLQDFVEDLQLQGNNNDIIMEQITSQFGEPEHIGKQMYAVHRRLERIPFVGPVLYYQPLLVGLQAMAMLYGVLILLLVFAGIINNLLGAINNFDSYPPVLVNRLLNTTYTLVPILGLVIGSIAVGYIIVSKLRSLAEYLEALLVAYIPALLILFMLVVDAVLSAKSWAGLSNVLRYSWIDSPITIFSALVVFSLASVIGLTFIKSARARWRSN